MKELVFMQELSGKTTKTFYQTKEKYLATNQVLARIDGKRFCKNRVMVKAGILPSISEETVGRVLQKTDVKMDSSSEERNPDQRWPKTET